MLVAAVAASTALGASALPHIKWLKSSHQFGSFSEDLGSVSCTFRGVNTGDETLVIYDVKTNCGCTTTKRYSGREYEPGDTIEIEATYSATGRPGAFTKKVQLLSNSDRPKETLILQGTVIGAPSTLAQRYPIEAGPIRMHKQTSLLGEVLKGRTGGSYVRCYNSSADTLAPVVTSTPPYLSAIVEPAKVKPGEQFVVSLSYNTARNPRWGLQSDTVTFVPVRAGAPVESAEPIELTTVVTIKEDFTRLTPKQREEAPVVKLTPSMVDLKRVSRNSGKIERKVTIANEGRSELIIRQVTCVSPAVTFRLADKRVKPGRRTELTVTVDLSRLGDVPLLDARIMITANDPENPTTMLRVVGELTD